MENRKNKISETAFKKTNDFVKSLIENPSLLTENREKAMNKLFKLLCEERGLSEHSFWGCKWTIEKRNSRDEKPYETLSGYTDVATAVGNVILNGGANEMLKLICGTGGATAYDNTNARIYVGTDTTLEKPDQTGVIATSLNRASAKMDSGYPQVSGRKATFRATFNDGEANFAWAEMSLTNGEGSSIALNRKQKNMGTKNGGIWSVQLEVNIVDMQ